MVDPGPDCASMLALVMDRVEACGNDAVEVISGNPYRLARAIRGIGFKLADTIAMKLGVEKAATTRVRAGIGYVLDEATKKGHCGLPVDEFRPLAAELEVDEPGSHRARPRTGCLRDRGILRCG